MQCTAQLVQKVLSLEGMFLTKFDFCQLGMTTPGAQGESIPAKKRTAVVTTSKNIAVVLRLARAKALTPTSRWWEAVRRPARSTHGSLSS